MKYQVQFKFVWGWGNVWLHLFDTEAEAEKAINDYIESWKKPSAMIYRREEFRIVPDNAPCS